MVLSAFILVLSTAFSVFAGKADAAEHELDLNVEAAMLVDADRGRVLFEKNADVVLGVASMSKMMTEYLVLEAIDQGKITWDQTVKINEYVSKLSAAPGLSNVGLTQGQVYTVQELYEAMAIFSGNAAAVALGELVGGTEKNFVEMMNKKAEELDLKDYKFVNSTGLNNGSLLGKHPAGSPTEENVMSARAVVKLAFRLLKDFPEVLDTASRPRLEFKDGRTYDNFNFMLPGLVYEYEGVDGLKTGSTDLAGYGFTATAKRDDQRFISVVMKADNRESRFTETEKILNYAFINFEKDTVVGEGFQLQGQEFVPVIYGKEDKVKVQTTDELALTVKKDEKDELKPKLVLDQDKLNEEGKLTAPINKGDEIGYMTVESKDGQPPNFLYGEGEDLVKVKVVAGEDVQKANWLILTMDATGSFFSDFFDLVVLEVKEILT
jgi:serine-type D-Ala-D-Ala carboxypeptidase (penicillin-binding protein 5/6)